VKLSLCLTKYHTMKMYLLIKYDAMKHTGGVELWPHIFLTSALDGGEWRASQPSCFISGERDPGTHTGGWVGPESVTSTVACW